MIIEFSNPEQLKAWREECAPKDKYRVFMTHAGEVVFRPTKSTPTYDFGYYESASKEKLEQLSKSLTEAGYKILHVFKIHWNSERFGNSEVLL